MGVEVGLGREIGIFCDVFYCSIWVGMVETVFDI